MNRPARFSRRALRELASVLDAMEHAAAAERLRAAIDTAARRIGQHSEIGRREIALAGPNYRFWSLPGFPYLLVYLSTTSPPSIVRFVHTAQDLGPLLAALRQPDDAPD